MRPNARYLLISLVVCFVGLVYSVQVAVSLPLTWILEDVKFEGGGTAKGLFEYDATDNTYSKWSITTDADQVQFFYSFTYNNESAPNSLFSSETKADFITGRLHRRITLAWDDPITKDTKKGDTRQLSGGGEMHTFVSGEDTDIRSVDSGAIRAVPEPAIGILIGTGLICIAGVRHKWRKTQFSGSKNVNVKLVCQ